jgi:hypothetical protein
MPLVIASVCLWIAAFCGFRLVLWTDAASSAEPEVAPLNHANRMTKGSLAQVSMRGLWHALPEPSARLEHQWLSTPERKYLGGQE